MVNKTNHHTDLLKILRHDSLSYKLLLNKEKIRYILSLNFGIFPYNHIELF